MNPELISHTGCSQGSGRQGRIWSDCTDRAYRSCSGNSFDGFYGLWCADAVESLLSFRLILLFFGFLSSKFMINLFYLLPSSSFVRAHFAPNSTPNSARANHLQTHNHTLFKSRYMHQYACTPEYQIYLLTWWCNPIGGCPHALLRDCSRLMVQRTTC